MTQTEWGPTATRIVGGAELPAPGRWQIDPGHTELAFIGRLLSARASGWQGTRGVLARGASDSLRGVTRPVALQAEYLGYAADPWGGHRAVFTAAGTIHREDWGLTWNMPLDGGGLVVSSQIRIEIELEAVLQP